MGYQEEKRQKQLDRDLKRMQRAMSTPIARGEVFRLGETQMMHLASLALAVEALEDILVGKGVLEPDELMEVMKSMAEQKAEVVAAADAATAASQSSLICSA